MSRRNVKRKKKNKFVKLCKVIFALIIFLLIIFGGSYFYLNVVMGKMKGTSIHKTDLSKETNLYEKIATNLTKKEFDKVVTIALFGVDSRDAMGQNIGSRSDTIMLVSLNPANKSIKLISIPRDTYVTVPGHGNDKINAAYSYGQEALAVKTINSNFGLDIDQYATIDFSQVIYIVNALGGVEIEIDEQERQFINLWSKESYAISKGKYKAIKTKGIVNLTGEQTLAYMRNRDSLRGDFDRVERQRKVMTSIINKLSSKNLVELMKMSDTLLGGIKTNVNINEYFSYLPSLIRDKNIYLENVLSLQCPSVKTAASKMINGIYYYYPNKPEMKKEMYDSIYNK